ncbi:MAG TPA: hypothetical protein VJP85_02070 [Candidatus Baltobacteraceae bacterium]|nr:hypothetical protein [Candidatus Baltobacteraceae bacterium]
MNFSRILLAGLAWSAMLGSGALAAPPGGISVGGGVGAGAHGGIGIGAPPISVPKPQIPAIPPATAKANGSAHANAHSTLIAGDVMHGTVSSVTGTSVTVEQSNGAMQTYTVSPQTAARLQSYLNKTIAFHAQNGALELVGLGTPPLHGTLVAVNGSTAQVKLADGKMQTYTVSSQQAAWLAAHVGKNVEFWTSANGAIELNQRSHNEKHAHPHDKNP